MQYNLFSNDTKQKLSQYELNVKLLHSIYHYIYCTIEKDIDVWAIDEYIKFNDLIVYVQDEEAEINGTQLFDVEERLKIHKEYICRKMQIKKIYRHEGLTRTR